MSEELKPCPFCGGEASSLRDEDDCPYVACTSCHINLPAYRPGFEAKAAADWNRRAAPIAAQLDAELPPLLKPEQIVPLWDALRPYHGGEPCKLGHVEFAHAIEREIVAPYAERIRLLEHKVWCAEVNLDGAKEHVAELEREHGLLSLVADQLKARVAAADAHIERLEAAERSVASEPDPLERACEILRAFPGDLLTRTATSSDAATDYEYELHQDDMMVAGTSGKGAYKEILRYAAQYVQDGPVEIFKVARTKLSVPAAVPSPQENTKCPE